MYRAAGWLIAAGVAICAGLSSYVIANEVKSPALAYAAGFPPSGAAQGNVASLSYGVRLLKDPKATITAREERLARQAYRAEPLSSSALALVILAPGDRSGTAARQALLKQAGKLTRRNALLNSEQIKAAAQRGDDKAFFRWLSRSVLTNNELRTAYVGAMAAATAKDGAVEALAPVIGPSPVWADFYWKRVNQLEPSLANAAKLRVAVARAPWRQTAITETDEHLSLGLVNSGQFDAAYQLARGLGQRSASTGRAANLLVNSDFARQPQLPPFDWRLAVSGALGSSIDTKDKSLLVSAIGGARGVAASQLVRLSPGNYTLGWSLSASMPIDADILSARIYCAEPGIKAVRPLPVSLVAGKKTASVAIADSMCRWYWVSLYVALPDDSAGVDAYFRNITLAPATGNDAGPAPTPVPDAATGAAPN